MPSTQTTPDTNGEREVADDHGSGLFVLGGCCTLQGHRVTAVHGCTLGIRLRYQALLGFHLDVCFCSRPLFPKGHSLWFPQIFLLFFYLYLSFQDSLRADHGCFLFSNFSAWFYFFLLKKKISVVIHIYKVEVRWNFLGSCLLGSVQYCVIGFVWMGTRNGDANEKELDD